MARSKKDAANGAVTKADLDKVESNLRTEIEGVDQRLIGVEGRLEGVEDRFDRVEARLDRVEGKVDGAIKILQTLDERTKDWKNLPERMEKLEEEVAELSLKR
jgi:archaellum component FlaC